MRSPKQKTAQWGTRIQALMYIVLGINHFWHSAAYVVIMPTHYSDPHLLVLISGAAEILGGLGLLQEQTRRWSAWGLMLMLVVYFDVHIFMITHAARFPTIPIALLYVRIPIQFWLIAWARSCTRTPARREVALTEPSVA